ncbi:hypothetical protein KV112_12785 [Mycolicibacter sp. MYC123]|uniref:Uncharacterized protein n=2 Tax=Mycolicibacter TaxID=1073531 RepID=A0ABU5YL93_9MYCO|nr:MULTISPECIES: hypothetical protein [unclassified Mycolicibacter]MEB3050606.1 hypothetical protein [Mycolicibacter sp. MYC123]MEB3063355.1 hypothetical protein [Mycolicibacter sp. MYC101]MEB3070468.1 hypothetical protein [Mycolicibacter sp. MYC017]
MNVNLRLSAAIATAVAVLGCGQLIPAPASAAEELHNVTYIARVDAWTTGSVVTFMRNDTETASADLDGFGAPFEANTVMADPSKAGMVIRLKFPTTANVHCEIKVDDVTTVKSDRFVNTWGNTNDPHVGAMLCGALISSMA